MNFIQLFLEQTHYNNIMQVYTGCAHAQIRGYSSMNNAHSEIGQMTICCQTLTLGTLGSCSALSMLIGALFKKFSIF
jgi:hypothetical protein